MKPFNQWVREDHTDEKGYWAGAGGGASGILPICTSTKRICLAWRSGDVHEGNCWGTLGGAVQHGMSPAESAEEELREETGYHGDIKLVSAYVFKDGSFKYHNFLGLVPKEFPFHSSDEHSWETDHIEWKTYQQIQSEIKQHPRHFHTGLLALFKQSGALIIKHLGLNEDTAKVYHGGDLDSSRQPVVTFWSPNLELAKTYIDMSRDRFGGNPKIHEKELTIKPAPWDIIQRECHKIGIDPEEGTPASVFDENIHDRSQVKRLADSLRKLGYTGAILDDTSYGRPQIEDKAWIEFKR